jgi:hypothetical protein
LSVSTQAVVNSANITAIIDAKLENYDKRIPPNANSSK